ncbi:MFS transporter [Sorangium sp. So ce1182]|uniref:MFS transporter n=1 Tax=Sorangium sp. So ce1182 TaxID=3133334 RepID=UPI003F61B6D3
MSAGSPAASLWQSRDFKRYWAGQSLSVLGDAFAVVATPLLVLGATGSVVSMGLVTAMAMGGNLFAGFFSGVLVDRVDLRKLMIACDCARGALWGGVALLFWLAGPQIWSIYAAAAIAACVGNTFQVACITALVRLVERDQIIEANGRLQASYALMAVAGPALSGLVCARVGPVAAIAINAVSFGLSALSIATLRFRDPAPHADHDAPARRGVLRDLSTGLRFIWRHPQLRAIIALVAATNLVVAARVDLLVFHIKHDLRQTDASVGQVFSLVSIGAIVGAIVTPRLRRRWGFAACFLGGGAAVGVASAAVGVLTTPVTVALAAMVAVFADTIRSINAQSLRQECTPPHLLGRVTASWWLLTSSLAPAGAALMTALITRLGTAQVFLLGGAWLVLLAFVGVFTPIRERRPAAPLTQA